MYNKFDISQSISNNYTKIVLTILSLVFIVLIVSFSKLGLTQYSKKNDIHSLSSGWVLHCSDKITQLSDLPVIVYRLENHAYTITNTIPYDIHDDNALVLLTGNQFYSININGKEITESGQEKELFRGYHLVPVENSMQGQSIAITLESPTKKSFRKINEVFYGKENDCIRFILQNQFPLLVLNLTIFLSGIIMIIIYIISLSFGEKLSGYILFGLQVMLGSLFIALQNNLLGFIFTNNLLTQIISFVISLFLFIPGIIYLFLRFKDQATKNMLLCLTFCILFFDLFQVESIATGTTKLKISLSNDALLSCSIVLLLIVLTLLDIVRKNNYQLIWVFLGIDFLGLCLVIELFSTYLYPISFFQQGIYVTIGLIILLLVFVGFNQYEITIERKQALETQKELQASKAEIMLSQIKPHFIYNSLNSIQALIDIDPKEASTLILNFTKYLRSHIDIADCADSIPFSQELDNIQTYVAIEQMRFPNIKVIFDIRELNFSLPALSIQPLVENAIKHGIPDKNKGGTVAISSYRDKNYIVITVQDDGPGFHTQKQSEDKNIHVGLNNTQYRLRQLCHGEFSIEDKEGKGTRVTIRLPNRKQK